MKDIWKFVFKFRNLKDLDSFLKYFDWEFGYEEDEYTVNRNTRTLTVYSELIDSFAPLAREAIMGYIPVSVKCSVHKTN